MSMYEYFEERKRHCLDFAAKAQDARIKLFYNNAAAGYALKQSRMTIKEANGCAILTTAQQKLLFKAKEASR